MLSAKVKDIKIRHKFYNTELNKNINKFLFTNVLCNPTLSFKVKAKARVLLLKLINKNISKTKITRRCSITNRNRVSDRKLGISRILLRDMLRAGIVPGYKKAIW